MPIGAPELIIILVIALLILGPGKLPEVGASLGKTIREFRKASTDIQESVKIDTSPLPATPQAPAAPQAPLPPQAPEPPQAPVAEAVATPPSTETVASGTASGTASTADPAPRAD